MLACRSFFVFFLCLLSLFFPSCKKIKDNPSESSSLKRGAGAPPLKGKKRIQGVSKAIGMQDSLWHAINEIERLSSKASSVPYLSEKTLSSEAAAYVKDRFESYGENGSVDGEVDADGVKGKKNFQNPLASMGADRVVKASSYDFSRNGRPKPSDNARKLSWEACDGAIVDLFADIVGLVFDVTELTGFKYVLENPGFRAPLLVFVSENLKESKGLLVDALDGASDVATGNFDDLSAVYADIVSTLLGDLPFAVFVKVIGEAIAEGMAYERGNNLNWWHLEKAMLTTIAGVLALVDGASEVAMAYQVTSDLVSIAANSVTIQKTCSVKN